MINRNTQIALARASVACVYECDLEVGENNGAKASMVSHSWPQLTPGMSTSILNNDPFCLCSLRFVSLLLRPPAAEHVFRMLGIAILPLPKTCL